MGNSKKDWILSNVASLLVKVCFTFAHFTVESASQRHFNTAWKVKGENMQYQLDIIRGNRVSLITLGLLSGSWII